MKKIYRFTCILALVVSTFFQVQPAHAATIWTVRSNVDGAANAANCPGSGCRLRDALAAANDGDTINFSLTLPATISLINGQMFIPHDITLTGPGSTSLSLNGNNLSRIFNIQAGRTVFISGITITQGKVIDSWGGGILMVGTSLTLNDVVLDQNTVQNSALSTYGGGIYSSGNLTITNSKFTGNFAGSAGGAIFVDVGTTLNMTGVLIQGNKARSGGGVTVSSLLTPSTSISTIILNNVSMDGNTATGNGSPGFGNGGGLFIGEATIATISNSTFSNNYAATDSSGGGIYTNFPGIVNMTNVTISDNHAQYGAGLFSSGSSGTGYGPINMNNATIAGNAATADAGGVYSYTDINLKNSLIAGNTDTGGNKDCHAPINSQDYNLIDSVSVGCVITGTPTHDLYATSPMLVALADNGGPTQTRALQTGSPAIDAANNATCASTDQRGAPRPQDGNLDGTATCDIGAYELDITSPTVQTIARAGANPTSAASVNYTVTFSESVTGVDAGDFTLTTTGVSGATVSGVSGSGSTRTVTVNTGTNNGTIRLDVPVSATITDMALHPLTGGLPFTGGQAYTVTRVYKLFLPLLLR